jgi:hypothetical protein
MKILYIIGNGFDLWHGLPTKYADFYVFAANYLDELEEYFLDPCSETSWTNFEENLGRFDWREFYDRNNFTDISDESFKPSMAFGLEDDLTEQASDMVDSMKSHFQEWIESIPIDDAEAKFDFTLGGRFISFNYTPLLQAVYEIPDSLIFHIHGSVSKYDDLIFGHGESREEEPELDENGDSNRHLFTDAEDAAKYPFYAFQKPVDDILNRNSSCFESLNNVEVVVIIGHSLNAIDLPYIRRISGVTRGSKWVVSQCSEDEGKHHITQLEKCGVTSDKITSCFIEDIPTVLETMGCAD